VVIGVGAVGFVAAAYAVLVDNKATATAKRKMIIPSSRIEFNVLHVVHIWYVAIGVKGSPILTSKEEPWYANKEKEGTEKRQTLVQQEMANTATAL